MEEHLGDAKHAVEGRNLGNSRNGTRSKTVITEIGPVEIEVLAGNSIGHGVERTLDRDVQRHHALAPDRRKTAPGSSDDGRHHADRRIGIRDLGVVSLDIETVDTQLVV